MASKGSNICRGCADMMRISTLVVSTWVRKGPSDET